jgi:hypothetical protein
VAPPRKKREREATPKKDEQDTFSNKSRINRAKKEGRSVRLLTDKEAELDKLKRRKLKRDTLNNPHTKGLNSKRPRANRRAE